MVKSKISKGLVLIALLTTQSCMKDVSIVPDDQPSIKKVQDLEIPLDFDWSTSRNITCTINSGSPASIEIYTDEACEEELLAALITQQGANELAMPVSQATDKLYLKYKTTAGSYNVLTGDVENAVVAFNVTDGVLAEQSETRSAVTRDVPIENHIGYIAYPAGWGTVMFEDQFPSIGDYDFNDLVASYQISTEFPWVDGKYDTKQVSLIRVHLKLKAIGGSLKFTPYVRIKGLNRENVTLPNPAYGDPLYVNPKIVNNTNDGVEVALINSTRTTDAIIEFKNLNESNPKKVPGGSFYNTTPGFLTKDNQLTQVTVYLALTKNVDAKSVLDDKIDIFLASADKTKEIHVRGFEPVFNPYNFDEKGVSKTVPYASENNLVWGIKIATRVKYAIEKVNFCEAYPDFASWAESGGISNVDWYKTNLVNDKLITLPAK